MVLILALSAAFVAGVDPRRLALLAGAVHLPLLVGALIAVHWLRSRPDEGNQPALFCEGVASELRAGATLRDAIATAATSVGALPMPSHHPQGALMTEVAANAARAFPAIGEELRLTIVAAGRSGSDAANLFDEIGALAMAQSEIRREVRVASAPGRATALVLVGAPVFYLITQFDSGGISSLLESSQQRVAASIGLGLFLLGLAGAGLVVWRAGR